MTIKITRRGIRATGPKDAHAVLRALCASHGIEFPKHLEEADRRLNAEEKEAPVPESKRIQIGPLDV